MHEEAYIHQYTHGLHTPNRWRSQMERTPLGQAQQASSLSILLCMFSRCMLIRMAYSDEQEKLAGAGRPLRAARAWGDGGL